MGNTTSLGKENRKNVLPIAYRGVRLRAAKDMLNELEEKHSCIAKRKLSRDPTPGEVIVEGYIKEKSVGESFAEYLAQRPATAQLVGKCNVFLSHTWGSPFQETVAAIEEWERQLPKGSATSYYFIDYFAINQFDPNKDLKELGTLAMNSNKLLLLTSPWNKPAALGRAWCIFELAHAVLGKTELVLALPPKEKKKFYDELQKLTHSELKAVQFLNIFSGIETSNMKASVSSDLWIIQDFIRYNLGGFEDVDQSVSEGLRKCVGKIAFDFGESFTPSGTAEHVEALKAISRLLNKLRMNDYYLKCAQHRREICQELNMESDLETAMNSESLALSRLGRHAEAISIGKKLLGLTINRYGSIHKRTLDRQLNLARAYVRIEKWDEAEDLLTKCLEGFRQLPTERDIKRTKTHLALVLRDSRKDIDRAIMLLKEVIDWFTGAGYDPERPYGMVLMINYERCMELKGHQQRAFLAYRKALPILTKTYGENSHHVKDVRRWMAEFREAKENLIE